MLSGQNMCSTPSRAVFGSRETPGGLHLEQHRRLFPCGWTAGAWNWEIIIWRPTLKCRPKWWFVFAPLNSRPRIYIFHCKEYCILTITPCVLVEVYQHFRNVLPQMSRKIFPLLPWIWGQHIHSKSRMWRLKVCHKFLVVCEERAPSIIRISIIFLRNFGCNSVQSSICLSTFLRNVLPPFSG